MRIFNEKQEINAHKLWRQTNLGSCILIKFFHTFRWDNGSFRTIKAYVNGGRGLLIILGHYVTICFVSNVDISYIYVHKILIFITRCNVRNHGPYCKIVLLIGCSSLS